MQKKQKHCVVYCSPGGSTRHVAHIIVSQLQLLGCQVEVCELWQNYGNEQNLCQQILHANPQCLWCGTPVYALHAVPPVQKFLENLYGIDHEVFAVPFVTWGGVTSGMALFEMASALISQGMSILGAAKVLALHSSMWQVSNPFGQGHPDEEDDRYIKDLVSHVVTQLDEQQPQTLSVDRLDYQIDWVREQAKEIRLAKVKSIHPGFHLDQEACTQCGTCAENCPVNAISLIPYPEIGTECILCNNCVRTCPEGAFSVDLSGTLERIQTMAKKIHETPSSQIFV
jgi:ferredoxin/flavodoxin